MITRAKEILAGAKSKMGDAVAFLEEDLKTYRAGKANPMVFNNSPRGLLRKPYSGSAGCLRDSSGCEDLMIQPWEKKMIPVIEKAILDANVGLTPQITARASAAISRLLLRTAGKSL